MKRELKHRIRERRKALGLSLEQLAELVGVKYQTIQDLESGKSRGTKHLLSLARALKVAPIWLESEQGEMEDDGGEWTGPSRAPSLRDNIVEIAGAEFARMPIFDIQLAAGVGANNPYEGEEPLDYHYMSLSLLRSMTRSPLERVFGVQVKGDSMEGTLHDRDWVIVDGLQTQMMREGIFALNNEGEAIVKRVSQHIETRAVTLISDNLKYPPQLIKKPDRLNVIGRVIFSIRRH